MVWGVGLGWLVGAVSFVYAWHAHTRLEVGSKRRNGGQGKGGGATYVGDGHAHAEDEHVGVGLEHVLHVRLGLGVEANGVF